MKNLYERDYMDDYTEDEINIINEINKRNENIGRRFGKINYFIEMPKAYRHKLSLFPNFYMDPVDLKNKQKIEKEAEDYLNKLNEGPTEQDLQALIKKNQYYDVIASIVTGLRMNFGHHDLYLFPEFPLGTSYVADYLLVGSGSGGYEFVFVELESPSKKATIKNGNLGDSFRKGIDQIIDWKIEIEGDYSLIRNELKKYQNKAKELPSEFIEYDSTRFHYVVVAGRRDDFNKKTRIIQRQNVLNGIQLLHYDNLYDFAVDLIGRHSY